MADDDDYAGAPVIGKGIEAEAKAEQDKAKAEEAEAKAEKEKADLEIKTAKAKADAEADAAKAKAKAEKPSKLWGAMKWAGGKAGNEAKEQLVSNGNVVGIVAVLFVAMVLYNFFRGFNVISSLLFSFIVFFLIIYLGDTKINAAKWAIGTLVLPPLIINVFIAKTVPVLFYFFIPKVVFDFFLGLLPSWSKEVQIALTMLVLVLTPSLLFIFGRVKIEKDTKSVIYSLAQIIYIAAVIYALFSLGSGFADVVGIPAAKTVAQVLTMGPEGQKLAAEAGQSLMKSPQTVSKWLSSTYQQQINIATGGEYYAGQVEQTKNAPVGVYIESLKPGDPVIYSRQPVSVWADLRVVTLADKPVTIKTSCTAEDPIKGTIKGKTLPTEIEIDLTGRDVVQCKFDSFEHGSVPVNFTAAFEFTTQAYINAYFMERDRLVALLNENKNPYDLYPVPTTSPQSIYTNGPIEIGMSLESPIGVSTASKSPMPILGVTLSPRWKGSISDISSVVVYVPDGIELDKESCDHAFVSTPSTKTGYNAYKLSGTESLRQSLNATTYQTFRCRLKLLPGSSESNLKVLQNEKGQQVPLATKYVFVDTTYTFSLVSQLTLNVKESPEEEQERIAAAKAKLAGTTSGSTSGSKASST